jgi:hypothetical protein
MSLVSITVIPTRVEKTCTQDFKDKQDRMNKKAAIFFRKQEESYELQGCEENHQTSIYQAEIKDTRPALGSRQDTTRAPNLTLNVSLPPCLSLLS